MKIANILRLLEMPMMISDVDLRLDDDTRSETSLGKVLIKHPKFWMTSNGSNEFLLWTPTGSTRQLMGRIGYTTSNQISDFTISGVTIGPKFRGNQLLLTAYLELARRGFDILSDDIQTPAGLAVWDKLAQEAPKHGFRVLGYNSTTDSLFVLSDLPSKSNDNDIQFLLVSR